MTDEDVIHEFFHYGCQYYVAGRYGVFAALMPVAANLHHHAIEMLIKGALSKTKSVKEMKSKLGHKLDACWDAFKLQADDPSLNRFDRVIEELSKFEDIRYPDRLLEQGGTVTMMFDVTKAGAAMASSSGATAGYKLCLEEIDELVAEIFKVGSRNPDAYLRPMMQPRARISSPRQSSFQRSRLAAHRDRRLCAEKKKGGANAAQSIFKPLCCASINMTVSEWLSTLALIISGGVTPAIFERINVTQAPQSLQCSLTRPGDVARTL